MLERIRRYYKASRVSIANFLGISLGSVKVVISGQRTLATQPMQAALLLLLAIDEETPLEALPNMAAFHAKEATAVKATVAKDQRKIARKLERKQEALQMLTAWRAEAIRGVNACEHLLKNEPLTPHQEQWINLRRKHLLFDLEKKSLTQVNRLTREIRGLTNMLQEVE